MLFLLSILPVFTFNNQFLSLEISPSRMEFVIRNNYTQHSLVFPLNSLRLKFNGEWVGGEDLEVKEVKKGKETCEVVFHPLKFKENRGEVEISLHYSISRNLLRKWARIKLREVGQPLLLEEVVLEELQPQEEVVPQGEGWQSYPLFGEDFFLGVEFPVAYALLEGERARIGHRPGVLLGKGETYETKKEVLGVAPRGKTREAFEAYIEDLRPHPKGFHINYNTWWSAPFLYSERDILNLIEEMKTNLYEPYHIAPDTFCIDAGWSDPKSIWRISEERFPQGFANLQRALARMGSRLGLWISPSACYPFTLDLDWAEANGYEIFPWGEGRYACLGGRKYQTAFKESLLEMVKRYDIHHIKFDGYIPECPSAQHGHPPGMLSREQIAEGIIDIFQALRKAQPDIWLEPTCFGWNPSPWWLMYVNSVIGVYGDDAPYGRVPAPLYRQSYTSARDYYNLHGADQPIPVRAQEVLGIVHQTVEPLYDDAVITIMRGHFFLPLYVNPRCMSREYWGFLGEILRWAKENQTLLWNTKFILPEEWQKKGMDWGAMPRQPYGYAHWNGKEGLICLRNPWIEEQEVELSLDSSLGIPEGTKGLSLLRLYPYYEVLSSRLSYGEKISIRLRSYETTVLALKQGEYPTSSSPRPPLLEAKDFSFRRERVEVKEAVQPYGPNWTSLVGEASSYYRISFKGDISLPEGGEVIVLLEYPSPFHPPHYIVRFKGKEIEGRLENLETGWAASQPHSKAEYWTFIVLPLRGFGRIEGEVFSLQEAKVSIWLMGRGKREVAKSALFPIHPQWEATRTMCLLPPTSLKEAPTVEGDLPLRYIEGVYLDTLKPLEVEQGWGTLQFNKSVQGNSLRIGSKVFLRGLGTHAVGRIVYRLDGKYRRFTAIVGQDRETYGSIKFEVWADERKLWESGVLTTSDEGVKVDLDISGAKVLELRVGDGGDGINGDHADWAEAILYP